jgi:hypothetical protein
MKVVAGHYTSAGNSTQFIKQYAISTQYFLDKFVFKSSPFGEDLGEVELNSPLKHLCDRGVAGF